MAISPAIFRNHKNFVFIMSDCKLNRLVEDVHKSINLKIVYFATSCEWRRKKLLDYSTLRTFFTSISKANIAWSNLVLTNLL